MRQPTSKDNLEEKDYFNSTFQTQLYRLKQVFMGMKNHLDSEIEKL